jgi:ActR/RegA family two-component response regulator
VLTLAEAIKRALCEHACMPAAGDDLFDAVLAEEERHIAAGHAAGVRRATFSLFFLSSLYRGGL